MPSSTPIRNLMVTGIPAAPTAARTMSRSKRSAHRERRAAALARHLRHRAPKFMSTWSTHLAHQAPHGLAQRARVGPYSCTERVASEPSKRSIDKRPRAPLDQRASGDHLPHVQPRAEARAQATERTVGDPRHRCEHDRRVDLDRPDAKRHARARSQDRAPHAHPTQAARCGRLEDGWRVTAAQRSVISMSMWPSSRRSRGSDRPRTVPWSPSMRSTNGAA